MGKKELKNKNPRLVFHVVNPKVGTTLLQKAFSLKKRDKSSDK